MTKREAALRKQLKTIDTKQKDLAEERARVTQALAYVLTDIRPGDRVTWEGAKHQYLVTRVGLGGLNDVIFFGRKILLDGKPAVQEGAIWQNRELPFIKVQEVQHG